jgi:acyl-CoA hydrolase
MVHVVFPEHANHYGTLFGGTALAWMDLAAFVAATRYCRQGVVTASSDRVDFKVPVRIGSMVEMVSRVVERGLTSLSVEVELFVEDAFSRRRTLCARGRFAMVAVNKSGRPIPLPLKQILSRSKETI